MIKVYSKMLSNKGVNFAKTVGNFSKAVFFSVNISSLLNVPSTVDNSSLCDCSHSNNFIEYSIKCKKKWEILGKLSY